MQHAAARPTENSQSMLRIEIVWGDRLGSLHQGELPWVAEPLIREPLDDWGALGQ
jgi:hypothetical protein